MNANIIDCGIASQWGVLQDAREMRLGAELSYVLCNCELLMLSLSMLNEQLIERTEDPRFLLSHLRYQ
jgi:hypothetical protein